jgi:hypothetical protein
MNISVITAALSGIWLGALVAIDLIETPAKFTILGLDRNTAVALGRVVFRRLGFLGMGLGTALVGAGWRSSTRYLGLSAALWLINVSLCLVIRPSLERKMHSVDFSTVRSTAAREFRPMHWLHRLYVAADGAKMLLLIALLAIAVCS